VGKEFNREFLFECPDKDRNACLRWVEKIKDMIAEKNNN